MMHVAFTGQAVQYKVNCLRILRMSVYDNLYGWQVDLSQTYRIAICQMDCSVRLSSNLAGLDRHLQGAMG